MNYIEFKTIMDHQLLSAFNVSHLKTKVQDRFY